VFSILSRCKADARIACVVATSVYRRSARDVNLLSCLASRNQLMAPGAKKILIRANRRNLPDPLVKKLFALSGNKCAMPNCGARLVYTEIDAVRGIICHIEAASRLGPRYNAQQSDEDRYDYSNLIILCPNCHADIDKNPLKYTVDYLQSIKQQHESKFEKEPYQPPDNILNVMKISVKQDEFSLNNILRLFMIYFKLKDPKVLRLFLRQ